MLVSGIYLRLPNIIKYCSNLALDENIGKQNINFSQVKRSLTFFIIQIGIMEDNDLGIQRAEFTVSEIFTII